MRRYEIKKTKHFERVLKKLIKRDLMARKRIFLVLDLLRLDPFSKTLRTHKVNTHQFGKQYSSRVTPDIRIIWNFIDSKTIILLLTIAPHSGKKKVYR